MAIPFVRANIISRKKGQSAVASAAYRSGDRLEDERYGKTHDYRRKEKIAETGIELPRGAPEWAKDRGKLWNAVEAVEGQKNSQLARELIVAVPHELSRKGQIELVQTIAKHLAKQGMAVDWALHDAPYRGDKRNIHAHVNTTMRELTSEGFGTKAKDSIARTWNSKKWMEAQKDYIAKESTRALKREGFAVEVTFDRDENSPQGQEHLGPKRMSALRALKAEKSNLAKEVEILAAEVQALETAESEIERQEIETVRAEEKAKEDKYPKVVIDHDLAELHRKHDEMAATRAERVRLQVEQELALEKESKPGQQPSKQTEPILPQPIRQTEPIAQSEPKVEQDQRLKNFEIARKLWQPLAKQIADPNDMIAAKALRQAAIFARVTMREAMLISRELAPIELAKESGETPKPAAIAIRGREITTRLLHDQGLQELEQACQKAAASRGWSEGYKDVSQGRGGGGLDHDKDPVEVFLAWLGRIAHERPSKDRDRRNDGLGW